MQVRDWGLVPYHTTLAQMRAFTSERGADTEDQVWLVEHPPVFTLGLAGKSEHILNAGSIAVEKVERGGQVTYHGPGQLVVYTLFDLRRLKLGVRDLVCQLEQCIIHTCSHFGLATERHAGAPGVYLTSDHPDNLLQGAKIAALGLKITRHCSYHGLALNVDMDLQPFSQINPCGFPGLVVTDLSRALSPAVKPNRTQVAAQLVQQLQRTFSEPTLNRASQHE